MAKHRAFLHIGPNHVSIDAEVRHELSFAGVFTPDVSAAEVELAELELLRRHKSAGLKRREVEGAWAHVCRRTFRVREATFVSAPALFDATADQAALALDGLAGLKVHLVVTGEAVPPAWAALVSEKHVHTVPSHLTPVELGAAVARLALVDKQDRLARKLAKLDKRRAKAEARQAKRADRAA